LKDLMTSSRGKRTSNPTGKVVKVVAARVGHRRSALTGRFIRTNASQNPRDLIADMHGVRGQPRVAGTSEWDRFEDRIVQELRRELHLQLRRAAVADIDIAAMGDPQDIAAAMVAVLPASHPFDEVIGPFYDTPGLTQWLQITRQALHQRIKAASVLGCPLDDGNLVYPAWQFLDNGATLPGLPGVLKPLSAGTTDPWQIALCLSAANEDLGDLPPRDWLRDNRSHEAVLALARQTAGSWAQ